MSRFLLGVRLDSSVMSRAIRMRFCWTTLRSLVSVTLNFDVVVLDEIGWWADGGTQGLVGRRIIWGLGLIG